MDDVTKELDTVIKDIQEGRDDVNTSGLKVMVKSTFGDLPEGDLPPGQYGDVVDLMRVAQTASNNSEGYNKTGILIALRQIRDGIYTRKTDVKVAPGENYWKILRFSHQEQPTGW